MIRLRLGIDAQLRLDRRRIELPWVHAHHDASGKPMSPPDPDGLHCARAAGADVELRIIPGVPHTDKWLNDRDHAAQTFAQARDAARAFLWKLVGGPHQPR